MRPMSSSNGSVIMVGQEVGRAQGRGDHGPVGDGIVSRVQAEGGLTQGVIALSTLKSPGIVTVAALVSVKGVVVALLLVGFDHVILDLLAHDARERDISAVVLAVVLSPGLEEASLILEEVFGHLGLGDLGTRTNAVARIRIHLQSTTSGVVGEVQLVTESRSNLNQFLGRNKVESARDVGNNGVENTNESVRAHAASFPADLSAEIVAHADTSLDASMVHDTHDIVNKLRCVS